MGRCPKCGAEINYLWYKELRPVWYRYVKRGEDFELEYDEEDEDLEPVGFYCPNCWELVCEDEEDAMEILEESNSPRAWEI